MVIPNTWKNKIHVPNHQPVPYLHATMAFWFFTSYSRHSAQHSHATLCINSSADFAEYTLHIVRDFMEADAPCTTRADRDHLSEILTFVDHFSLATARWDSFCLAFMPWFCFTKIRPFRTALSMWESWGCLPYFLLLSDFLAFWFVDKNIPSGTLTSVWTYTLWLIYLLKIAILIATLVYQRV